MYRMLNVLERFPVWKNKVIFSAVGFLNASLYPKMFRLTIG